MGDDAFMHVRSLVGPCAPWLAATSMSWSPCRAGRQTTGRTAAMGRMTAGRMAAAAAAVAGKLMVEAGWTEARRPQRAGVYAPARGPKHPSGWLALGSSNWLASQCRQFQRSSH